MAALFSPLLDDLIKNLQTLQGVGRRTAQRMAFRLLEHDREKGARLAEILGRSMREIRECRRCRNFTEQEVCPICASVKRAAHHQLCIVETPSDVAAIEGTEQYFGQYFVLHGHISPIDGIGPDEIGLPLLEKRFSEEKFEEVILAMSPGSEGSVTSYYISDIARKYGIRLTSIAHGVPMGGGLEYVDGRTLSVSLKDRKDLE